jgi:hypothetical protein
MPGSRSRRRLQANAFFTAGQVVFEIPTGVVADTRGRPNVIPPRNGNAFFYNADLSLALEYQGAVLGLGSRVGIARTRFHIFSGATEAWLVDGLKAAGYKGELDPVFAKGSIANGAAMLTGTITGGLVAQYTNLGVPYIMRIVALAATFLIAFFLMHDEGFEKKMRSGFVNEVKDVVSESVEFGLKNRPLRWMMLSAIFNGGVGIFVFLRDAAVSAATLWRSVELCRGRRVGVDRCGSVDHRRLSRAVCRSAL